MPNSSVSKQSFKSIFDANFSNSREPVDEKNAVEVVGLMLDGAGEQAVGFDD